MIPNFDNSELEPECLDSKYPVVLLKPSFGIGWGKYSGIPPFNLKELFELVIELIKNPNKKEVFLVPDFPTPCEIVDNDFKDICNTGEGKFRIRGIIEREDNDLIIKSIPYKTNTKAIINKLVDLAHDGKLPLKDIVDECESIKVKDINGDYSKLQIRIRLIFKQGVNLDSMKKIIYKSTPMEQGFGVNFELVNEGQNIHYNLRSLILSWIEYRKDMENRKIILEYKKVYKKFHEIEPIINILSEEKSDKKLAKLMRECENKKEQIQALMDEYSQYGITDIQAKIITNWNYSNYSKESLRKFYEEYDELKLKLEKLEQDIDNDELINKSIINTLREGINKYGRERMSLIVQDNDNYVENKEYTVIVTEKGYFKKIPKGEDISLYNIYASGDRIRHILDINNVDSMLIFTSNGYCYNLVVDNLDETPANGIGTSIYDTIKNLNENTRIVSVLKNPTEKKSDDMLLFVTKSGLVKKSLVGNYIKSNSAGLIAITLKEIDKGEKDEVVDVLQLGIKDRELVLYSSDGRGLRFNSKEIPVTLRMSSGVIGMRLAKIAQLEGASIIKTSKDFLIVMSNKGNGKKISIKDLEKSERGKSGCNLIKLDEDERILDVLSKNEDEIIRVYYSKEIRTILIENIKEKTLISRGDKLGPVNAHFID